MIISASRRTDIPAYYSKWLLARLNEGWTLVANPMNPKQVRRVDLLPEAVDGIVFWTKNPAPMLPIIKELRDYKFVFQFTLNAYGRDVEPGVPENRVDTLRLLSDKIGPERVEWRYDPIVISDTYPVTFHLRAFERMQGKRLNANKAASSCTKNRRFCNIRTNRITLAPYDEI